MLGGCLGANSRFGVGAALSGTTGHELKQSPQRIFKQHACVAFRCVVCLHARVRVYKCTPVCRVVVVCKTGQEYFVKPEATRMSVVSG